MEKSDDINTSDISTKKALPPNLSLQEVLLYRYISKDLT